jgi:hypothetical protein
MVANKKSKGKGSSESSLKHYQILTVVMTIAFVVMSSLWFVTFSISNDQRNTIDTLNQRIDSLVDANVGSGVISYNGVDGKTALELLKDSYPVETKDYSGMGEFVTSIDGVKAEDNKNFWAFYVDGQMASEGAGAYTTKNGEKIEWHLEEIQ